MAKCPVCEMQTENDNERLCPSCGWEFRYILGGLSREEEAIYNRKLEICRRNCQTLQALKNQQAQPRPDRPEPPAKKKESEPAVRFKIVLGLCLLCAFFVYEKFWSDTDENRDPITGGSFMMGNSDPVTGMEFIKVPGGTFMMGNTFGDGYDDEKPVHEVQLDEFYIGKYPVTQGQWKKVTGNNPSHFKKGDDYPVEQVSWNDTQKFVRRLTEMNSGKYQFRLPSEAEWEYAARSGGRKERYAGGDDIDAVAWYEDNSGDSTHPVGGKAPNGLGIHDMSGNVWEWCGDWFGDYPPSSVKNPGGPSTGSYRVGRGGGWRYEAGYCRSAYRFRFSPDGRFSGLGLRLALSPGQHQ